MTLGARRIWLSAAALAFVLASVKLHHYVKVEMVPYGNLDRVSEDVGLAGGLAVGDQAPDFNATDIGGREFALPVGGRRPVLLDFWASWCVPCLRAMPALERVNKDFADRGVDVLAVNLGEDPEVVRKFVDQQEHKFRVVSDPESRVGSLFGVRALPTQVVVGPDGRIEWIRVGYSSSAEDELRAVLERLVGRVGQGEVR